MKTVLVCGVQAPFITGGAEILVAELRVNLERRGFRVDVVNVPFKWYPVSEIVRQALAWRLLDVTESNGTRGGPRDPHQVPVLPRAPPAQGDLALPSAPRSLRPLRHALRLLHRRARRTRGCARRSWPWTRPGSGSAARCSRSPGTSRIGSRRYNGLHGTPLYPPPQHLGRYRRDGYRRLPLLRRASRPAEAARPGHRRHEARAAGGPAQDRGNGAAPGGAPEADRGPGRRGSGGAPGLRLRRRPDRPLRGMPRRLLRSPQRRLRLRDGGGLPLAASRCSPPPTPADPSSSWSTARTAWSRRPSPRRSPPASIGCSPSRRRVSREMGEEGHGRVSGITWDHVIDTPDRGPPVKLARLEPAAAGSLRRGRLRGRAAPGPRATLRGAGRGRRPRRRRSGAHPWARSGDPGARPRPISTSTTSGTRRPMPTSTERRDCTARSRVPARVEPPPPGAPRDRRARRRRGLPAGDAAGPRGDGHLRGPPGGARPRRRPLRGDAALERARPRSEPGGGDPHAGDLWSRPAAHARPPGPGPPPALRFAARCPRRLATKRGARWAWPETFGS